MAQETNITTTGPAGEVLVQQGATHRSGWLPGIVNFSRRNPLGAISAVLIIIVLSVAIFAPVVATHDPILEADFKSLREAPTADHWLGTDDIGRDLYSRIVHGARVSLFIAFMAVMVGDLFGAAWGVATGYIGGRFDMYSQRFLEVLMSFPHADSGNAPSAGDGRRRLDCNRCHQHNQNSVVGPRGTLSNS